MLQAPSSLPTAALAVLAATVIAGCGSSSHTSTRSSGSRAKPSLAQMQRDAVRFSGCMRSHDVPGFPDPTGDPRAFKEALDPSTHPSPAFASAETVCRHLLPGGGPSQQATRPSQRQIAALLALARCLRAHGFPRFPDPAGSGKLDQQMVAAAGIDIHQPALREAADGCVPVTHGQITKAMVAHFVAGH